VIVSAPNFAALTNSLPNSQWTLIDVTVSDHEAEIVSDFLWSHGVVAIEEIPFDAQTMRLRSSVGEQPQEFLELLQRTFPLITATIVHVEKSVSETWRQFAQPTWIEDDFVIVPQWLPTPQASKVLTIEPLDTFGLGNHPTTALALRLCIRHIPNGSEIFDLGSGSGILAIAAAKFLHCSSLAYDIAYGAQQALRLNADLNAVTEVSWIEGYPNRLMDVVVANILAPVLIEESGKISSTLRPGGVVILSGMRTEQLDKVIQHFPDFNLLDTVDDDGWTAVVLVKNER
jgi:ribosomal protein L11 methyltransferase